MINRTRGKKARGYCHRRLKRNSLNLRSDLAIIRTIVRAHTELLLTINRSLASSNKMASLRGHIPYSCAYTSMRQLAIANDSRSA